VDNTGKILILIITSIGTAKQNITGCMCRAGFD